MEWSVCSQCFLYDPFLQNIIILSRNACAVDVRSPISKGKKFYHCFSIVKYPYLPIDTFRKYVERHVTRSKLTFKFTSHAQFHRLLFQLENCYLKGFNLYFLYSKLHIFYKYIYTNGFMECSRYTGFSRNEDHTAAASLLMGHTGHPEHN